MFSISFRKQRDKKKENNLLTLIFKMQILFARAITTSRARASSVSPSSYTNMIFNQSVHVLSEDCFLKKYINIFDNSQICIVADEVRWIRTKYSTFEFFNLCSEYRKFLYIVIVLNHVSSRPGIQYFWF